MAAIRIIPCLDVHDGRVVKGVSFIDLRDAGDPADQAAFYDSEYADELCLLDISATVEARGTFLKTVEAVASRIFMPLTVGGGVRSLDDAARLLGAGADKVAINSAAVKTPELINEISKHYGTQALVVAVDAKVVNGIWRVCTHGGRQPTKLDAVAWAQEIAARGAGEILLTSIDRDGQQSGYDIPLLQAITSAVPVPVIASGGAGNLDHLVDAIKQGGAQAVLAASIFHFGTYRMGAARAYLAAHGVEVRQINAA